MVDPRRVEMLEIPGAQGFGDSLGLDGALWGTSLFGIPRGDPGGVPRLLVRVWCVWCQTNV